MAPAAPTLLPSPPPITDRIALGALTSPLPSELVDRVIEQTGRAEQRRRLLPARVVVYLVLALALYGHAAYEEVMRCLVERLGWAVRARRGRRTWPWCHVPGASALAAGVPLVVVLVSGRPMDVATLLPSWDALVEAWLPGTEGQGVADVLFGDYNPTGRLPDTWMQSAGQQPINSGDGKPALFPLGGGSGFPATQNPYNVIGAASYDGQSGTLLERCTDAGCGQNVGWIASGDFLYYDGVDFGATSPVSALTRLASGSSVTGTIQYRLDSVGGPLIASVPVSNTGGWQSWTSRTVSLSAPVTGVHRLYLVFTGPTTSDFVNVSWFQFAR